ncbi:hypothetical protein Srut_46850 [Streptomyces rutgersensis]|nr:hypothetical protein Srut_46850 [Streptomyces rutgersensis]
MRTDLAVDALAAARHTCGSLAGAVLYTDHGAQYTSRAFADACRKAGVRQSMSAIGSGADNALAESFNATFKRETFRVASTGPASERPGSTRSDGCTATTSAAVTPASDTAAPSPTRTPSE